MGQASERAEDPQSGLDPRVGSEEHPLLVNLLLCIPDMLPISRESGHTAWASPVPKALQGVQVSRESCPKRGMRAHQGGEMDVMEGEGSLW